MFEDRRLELIKGDFEYQGEEGDKSDNKNIL